MDLVMNTAALRDRNGMHNEVYCTASNRVAKFFLSLKKRKKKEIKERQDERSSASAKNGMRALITFVKNPVHNFPRFLKPRS